MPFANEDEGVARCPLIKTFPSLKSSLYLTRLISRNVKFLFCFLIASKRTASKRLSGELSSRVIRNDFGGWGGINSLIKTSCIVTNNSNEYSATYMSKPDKSYNIKK